MALIYSRIDYLEMALNRLEEGLEIFKKYSPADYLYSTCRDSVIQRFEFSFDLFWKCLKDYLEKQYGISVASPRGVFRQVFEQELVDEKEYELLESMIAERNDTSHRYDQAMAEEIVQHVQAYHLLMANVFDKFLQSK